MGDSTDSSCIAPLSESPLPPVDLAASSSSQDDSTHPQPAAGGLRASKSDTSLTDSFVVIPPTTSASTAQVDDPSAKRKTLQTQNHLKEGEMFYTLVKLLLIYSIEHLTKHSLCWKASKLVTCCENWMRFANQPFFHFTAAPGTIHWVTKTSASRVRFVQVSVVDASAHQLHGGLDWEWPVEGTLLTPPTGLSELTALHRSGWERFIRQSFYTLTPRFQPTLVPFSFFSSQKTTQASPKMTLARRKLFFSRFSVWG